MLSCLFVSSSFANTSSSSAAKNSSDRMLLLFETAAGFALFKVNKEDKLEQTNVSAHSRRPERRSSRSGAHCCCPADLPPLPAAGLCQGLRERGWRQEGALACRHTPMCQLQAKGMGASPPAAAAARLLTACCLLVLLPAHRWSS